MPRTVRGRVYRRVIRACPMLEVLHLKSCLTRARICFDTQTSRVKELVIDQCMFISVWLVRVLPSASDLRAPLGNLRRLLVADMPRSWDISWTCRLLEAAPFLETLHVHVTNHDSEWGTAFGPAIPEPPSGFRHGALREVVILGFEGTETQLHFVSFLTAACTVLENDVLLKYGCVQELGFWDWDIHGGLLNLAKRVSV
ncbi:hypothetical protein HU200_025661 [Digitaria exilis]|uniref:Uncharacterized protein n=1 Tax=Digitaria exilis TaxID=1010633 RepID=A0A835BWW8_9POAL|nr:hypothetical protein HU200_025661 [Digitaria exilis]